MTVNHQPRPFLKWPGGKRWLVKSLQLPIPEEYNTYIEPFLGGGAVYFHMRPSHALLSDINHELIELYEVIRDSPKRLSKYMSTHQELHCARYYYEMRETIPRGKVQRAARFLYLNRTCWNGLYRVNRKGMFNVPKGTKETVVFASDDFPSLSKYLSSARLTAQDFEVAISEANDGDFVFIDPPYTVKHNLNNFVKYNRHIFSWSDQERLRDAVALARQRGAMLVVTNANHPAIHRLYYGLGKRISVDRYSVLSGKSAHRRSTTEAIFRINF